MAVSRYDMIFHKIVHLYQNFPIRHVLFWVTTLFFHENCLSFIKIFQYDMFFLFHENIFSLKNVQNFPVFIKMIQIFPIRHDFFIKMCKFCYFSIKNAQKFPIFNKNLNFLSIFSLKTSISQQKNFICGAGFFLY